MKNAKKITSILIAASITMAMFVGCGSKTIASTTISTAATTATASTTTETAKPDSSIMKTTYTTVLKALVTDKTITQVQSDKVIAVVEKAMPSGEKPGGTDKEGGEKPTGSAPANGEKPSGTKRTEGSNSKNNQLASLVTNKVITQVQANTINTKVQAAMKSAQASK
ncbi:hypothetical protein [Clostridium estertheticum]|uniref:hypothetical protein n=1 Tax=Clostridium estertheticum TaxID=238834 RepID=UPI001C7D76D7|nr:hypothetical protein [Clostridium estertheticum]MBX4267424.1 hypothetical protein [Clostridium estertheticum]WLC87297.1 hypothetical protein KTC95_14180 [Clostridium estertheticum]